MMWHYCINIVMILSVSLDISFSTPVIRNDYTDDNSIVFKNREVKDLNLVEGDIITTHKFGFNADVNVSKKWPNGNIPYIIQSGHFCYFEIIAEMKKFEQNSCLFFYRRNSEKDYLYFGTKKGCHSLLGRTGGEQKISIGSGCCHSAIIQHEIMHAVGFYHEHNRPDRDQYIRIVWGNIDPVYADDFVKNKPSEVTTFNTTFDFHSTMMYGSNAFGTGTIVRKDNSGTIKGHNKMSSSDWYRLKKYYGCK
ncbi:nas-15 (predicted) [Pycnogonum litorale]